MSEKEYIKALEDHIEKRNKLILEYETLINDLVAKIKAL